MFSVTYICICSYCMLQLVFLLFMNQRRRKVRSVQERYFPMLLILTLCSFGADILSSLNHASEWIFPFAVAGNYAEIILNTLLLPFFFLYVCTQINEADRKLKHNVRMVLWVLAVICIGIVLSTFFNHKIFYFDDARVYHRASLFWLPMSLLIVMMLIIELYIVSQRAKIDVVYFKPLVAFLLLPVVGWGLQFFVYGLPFSLLSVTFAAQMVFTNIQNRSMDTDYLTGAYNRLSLDSFLQTKIDMAENGHSFSALLLDIDNFKTINDRYGHNEGDLVLINATKAIRASVGWNAFVARYGGDEFCIIFDEDDPAFLETAIQDIYRGLNYFNENKKKPYDVGFSIGGAVYDSAAGNSKEEFLRLVDQNMYDEKRMRKSVRRI